VGLAVGPVLEREGDLFGPTVNLASRLTNIALPGSVLTSNEVHDLLADDEAFTWRAMRPRYLKNIGRVALWVMRPSDAAPEGVFSTMAARRREARASFKDAIAERLLEPGS
jgi:adenylate cyclase